MLTLRSLARRSSCAPLVRYVASARLSCPQRLSTEVSFKTPLSFSRTTLKQLKDTKGDNTVVAFATHEESKRLSELSDGLIPSLPRSALDDYAQAKQGAIQFLYPTDGVSSRICLVNLGKEKSLTKNSHTGKWDWPRSVTHTAITTLRKRAIERASWLLPFASASSSSALHTHLPSRFDLFDLMTRTAVMSNFDFDKYRKPKDRVKSLKHIEFITDANEVSNNVLRTKLEQAQVFGAATVFAREMANERADVATPQYMEDMARTVATTHGLKCTVLDMSALRSQGYNLLTSVGQAAMHPPRLVTLEYNGNAEKKDCLALVGKGITFDSGGMNLKPGDYMDDMHLDMTGSAVVLATIKAIAALKLPVNVVAVLALAENAINERAYKPKSIITTAKGTVEVSNTDAEGRLALADAFMYVQKHFSCSHMIDVATLTGACHQALGDEMAGVFANDDSLASQLVDIGDRTMERVWRLPIAPEHVQDIKKADHSDFRSTGKSRRAGASTAAAFLEQFVEEKVKWAHLDIAGPAIMDHAIKFFPVGGTGFGVQLLCDFVLQQASGEQFAG